MSYLKTKDCKDYPQLVKLIYEHLNVKYGSSARISDFFNLWRDSYGITEYDYFNYKDPRVHEFLSYIMDKAIDWNAGREVDLHELYTSLLTFGDFTQKEKYMFETGDPEEHMWAVILSITDTTNKNKIY
jgi:hypothetical protein